MINDPQGPDFFQRCSDTRLPLARALDSTTFGESSRGFSGTQTRTSIFLGSSYMHFSRDIQPPCMRAPHHAPLLGWWADVLPLIRSVRRRSLRV